MRDDVRAYFRAAASRSRLLSPATFQRLHDIECDVAIVDRRYRPLERE